MGRKFKRFKGVVRNIYRRHANLIRALTIIFAVTLILNFNQIEQSPVATQSLIDIGGSAITTGIILLVAAFAIGIILILSGVALPAGVILILVSLAIFGLKVLAIGTLFNAIENFFGEYVSIFYGLAVILLVLWLTRTRFSLSGSARARATKIPLVVKQPKPTTVLLSPNHTPLTLEDRL